MANEKVVTVAFRLAFPEVFAPKAAVTGGKPKYSINALFPTNGVPMIPAMPQGAGIMELRKLAYLACREKWGVDTAKWPGVLRTIDPKTYFSPNGKDGWPFRDGGTVDWQGYEGMTFIRCASEQKPGVVDRNIKPIITTEDIFGGLICRAQINAYAYDNDGNKGVTFGLDLLQVLKDDGTVFSGRSKPEEVFSAFSDPDLGGSVVSSPAIEEQW